MLELAFACLALQILVEGWVGRDEGIYGSVIEMVAWFLFVGI